MCTYFYSPAVLTNLACALRTSSTKFTLGAKGKCDLIYKNVLSIICIAKGAKLHLRK